MDRFRYSAADDFSKPYKTLPAWYAALADPQKWVMPPRAVSCSRCYRKTKQYVAIGNLERTCPDCVAQELRRIPFALVSTMTPAEAVLVKDAGVVWRFHALLNLNASEAPEPVKLELLRGLDLDPAHPLNAALQPYVREWAEFVLMSQGIFTKAVALATASPERHALRQILLPHIQHQHNMKDPALAQLVQACLLSDHPKVREQAVRARDRLRRYGVEILLDPKSHEAAVLRPCLDECYRLDMLKRVHAWFIKLELLPPLARVEQAQQRKNDIVTAVAEALAKPEALPRLVAQWSAQPALIDTVTRIVWENDTPLFQAVEAQYGITLIPKKKATSWSYGHYFDTAELVKVLPAEWALLAVMRANEYLSYDGFAADLPAELKKALRPCVPKPAWGAWIPLPNPPKTRWLDTPDPGRCLRQLAMISQLLQTCELKRSSSGNLLAGGYKTILKVVTDWQPWFQEDGGEAKLEAFACSLRERLVVAVLDREPLLTGQNGAEWLRDWLERHLAGKNGIALPLYLLLPGCSVTSRNTHSPAVSQGIRKLLRLLPAGKWVTLENVLGYARVHDLNLAIADPPAYGRDGGWLPSARARQYGETLVVRPFVQGLAFLLNALGLLDLAYEPAETRTQAEAEALPRSSRREDATTPDVSPFSGLLALRLTPLGEYALGQRDTPPEIAAPAAASGRLVADPRRLLLTLHGADPLLALLLKEVADSVAPGVYRLSPAKILERCTGQADVILRLDKLRQVLPKELPPLWQEHLRQIKARAVPPKSESFSVYKLDPDSALAMVIAQTPELAELVLRAEDGHILVKRSRHAQFSAKLLSLGFIPPKA